MVKKEFLLCIALISFSFYSIAINYDLVKCDRYTIEDGLPQSYVETIYQGIKNIFQSPQKYKIQAELGRQHIIENFNWTKIGHAYEELLYKTINDFKC